MQDTDTDWLRLKAAAKRIGVARETARLLVVSGELAARRATNSPRSMYLVHKDECARYLAASELAA